MHEDEASSRERDAALTAPAEQAQAGEGSARLVARLSSQYLLRALKLVAEAYDGEILTAIVAQSIVAANTAHLDARDGQGASYAGRPPPDELRKPVSVLAIAGSLGLPFETTRRHVNKLVAAGRCVRVKGGVIVPASVLDHPRSAKAAETNLAYVRRFLRELKAAGVTAD